MVASGEPGCILLHLVPSGCIWCIWLHLVHLVASGAYGCIWCIGMVWYGMVLYSLVWFGIVLFGFFIFSQVGGWVPGGSGIKANSARLG